MRTESVTVRPFFELPQDVDEHFALTGVRFSEEEDYQSEPSLKVDIAPYEARLMVKLAEELLDVLARWNDRDDWRLTVVLADETKRRSAALASLGIGDLPASGEVAIPTSNLNISWMGRKGGTLSLFLSLGRDRAGKIGLPHRLGHVAAMKHFGINKSGPGAEFPVNFLSANDFKERGFPGHSTVLVLGDPGGMNDEKADEMGIFIAINDRLRAAFAHARRSRRANVLQDDIRSQAVAQLLLLAKGLEGLEPDSVGYKFVKQVLTSVGKAPEDLRSMDEVQVFAAAQVFCGLTESGAKVS